MSPVYRAKHRYCQGSGSGWKRNRVDSLLHLVIWFVEEEGHENVHLTLGLISGETVSGVVVPSGFAIEKLALLSIGLGEDISTDEEYEHTDALTLRVSDDTIRRIVLTAIAWWSPDREEVKPDRGENGK